MNKLTFERAQEEVERFLEEWDRKYKKRVNNHFYIFTHLGEEIGELARDMINAEHGLSTDRKPSTPLQREKVIARIEDDLGDILIHLSEVANAYEINLAEAFRKALNDNRKRFGMN